MGVEIYVGQLAGSVTEDEVRKLFSVSGTVTSVHLVKDPPTGEFRGCGYVRMSTEDEAKEAIGLLNGALLGDRLIAVKESTKVFGKKAGSSGDSKTGKARNVSAKR
ncbi:RNA recognition motif domain-containing protein [Pelotalea chapellei]|uniref:RNA-binding protein n=1 Tax=Pelotalea chapellei TaxID=44671 RepID=A0ABS5UBN6_9BACT|nr:RNA-binding protein [Pelotalea chapellei]MBT1073091.1 RNA-binding protein [Pelotalea chapellei]